LFVPLTGSTGFTKDGAGTLQIGGTSVGYTGITTVNAGTLAVSNSLALGFSTVASNLVLNNGSTIDFSSPSFNHNFTLTGGVVNLQITGINTTVSGSPTLTASTNLNLNGTGTTGILSGNLADTGANVLSVTKSGTGRTALSGNNTYTGPTTVTRGRLQLNSAGALSSGSNLVFNGAVGTGGTIELTSGFGNFTRGLGTGAGQVQWLGDGGFQSSGSDRSVNIGGAGATLTWGVGNFVPNGNRLILGTSSNNLLDFQNGIDLSGGIRAVQGDGGLITGHARMSGILSGTGGINQVGNGILEFTGANTYSGGTVMTSGILVVGSDGNLGAAVGTLTFDGGTLENTGAFMTARSVTINAPGGTFQTDANLEVSGPIAGAGRLTKTGVATLTLTGTGTYVGGTTINTGTLQIGNGGTTGSIVGNVIDSGLLVFNRSNSLIFGGAISGAGSLEQRGSGTTILTGSNTNTGGTTISAGTLQIGSGGPTGSLTGDVANGGVLAFDRSDTIAFGGIVSGAGSLEQRGSGTLTLTGANTYLGGTALDAGTIAVAADANLGAAAGALTFDGGTLQNTAAFAMSRNVLLMVGGGTFLTDADLLVSGPISGPGALTKQGVATLTLTGNNTYSGGTTISAGTLQIGNGGTSGSIVGDVTDNGVLAFNRSDALTFGGVISGAGDLEQRGSGTLTLTGNSAAFSGNASVLAGTLMVNGVLGGTLDVLGGGRLAGIGTVGSTSIASGGTLAPGAPFGTLSVVGNIGFAPGSVFEVKTDPAGVITLLLATGTVTIGGGTVRVITQDSVYRTGARYTILTAAGGRTGEFDALVQSLPLIDMTLAYGPNSVFLDVARNSTTLCSLAPVTRNQCATSTTEASLGTDNPLVAAILSLPNLAAIQNALNLASGEIYASANGALLENSRFVREAVVNRVRQTQDPAGTPRTNRAEWGHVFGSFGNRDGDGNAATIDTSIGGFFVGGDAVIADLLRLGMATGYSNSSFSVAERTSSGSSDEYPLAVYGGTQWRALGLRFGAAYTWHDIEVNRSILFPGFSDATQAEYGAQTVQAFGEAGYALTFGNLATEPFAQIAQVGLKTDAFDESGGAAALHLAKTSDEVTYATMGLHATQTFTGPSNWSATARGTLGWRRAFGDTLPLTTNAIGNSSTFLIEGVPIATDALVVDAGIDVSVADNVTLSLTYSGQVAHTAMDNGAWGNLTVRF
jgi:outer membrane autotransporter protein